MLQQQVATVAPECGHKLLVTLDGEDHMKELLRHLMIISHYKWCGRGLDAYVPTMCCLNARAVPAPSTPVAVVLQKLHYQVLAQAPGADEQVLLKELPSTSGRA